MPQHQETEFLHVTSVFLHKPKKAFLEKHHFLLIKEDTQEEESGEER
jgi:hypothetical protein